MTALPLPTVLSPLTLPSLLKNILASQSRSTPTTLLVCSSKAAFLDQLSHSLEQRDSTTSAGLQQLITPTLHNLATSRHVNIAFCGSVQALLAHLTAYGRSTSEGIGKPKGTERIVLVNPLALHAPTASFSAQGLSRTFAAVTETALRVGARLLVVECVGSRENNLNLPEDEETEATTDGDHNQSGIGRGNSEEEDPWEQAVPILNISARRSGMGRGERPWAGRTVKARRIAARWFTFRLLQEGEG